MVVRITNKSRNTIISLKAGLADSPFSRLIGLLNRKSLSSEEALIITDCRAIHMFFMKFPIDAIFVDKNNKVVGLVRNIRPFQLSPYFIRATKVIEACPGIVDGTETAVGDELVFSEIARS